MREKIALILGILCICTVYRNTWAGNIDQLSPTTTSDVNNITIELIRYEKEFSNIHIEPARIDSKTGLAVIFEGTEDLHYYAKPESAPAPGFELKIEATSDDIKFGEAVFPKWEIFQDQTGAKIEVYVGNFTVFIPILKAYSESSEVGIKITGLACTSKICLQPFEHILLATYAPKTHSLTDMRLEIKTNETDVEPIPTEAAGKSIPPVVLPYSGPWLYSQVYQ